MRSWFKILLPLGIILLVSFLAQKINSFRNSQLPKSGYLQRISVVNEASVDRIVIEDKKGKLLLTKSDDGWVVNNKKADENKVREILSIIINRNNANFDLISQNLSRFEEFGLSTPSAGRVILNSGSEAVLTLDVGNDSYPGTFIRVDESSEAYLTNKNLSSFISSDPQRLYEK